MKITGKFDVKLNPLDFYTPGVDGVNLGRMSIDKTFHGDLEGISQGEMLSAMTAREGSPSGKKGSFILQHFGTMDKGSERLILEVIPDSASGELIGLSGSMRVPFKSCNADHQLKYQ